MTKLTKPVDVSEEVWLKCQLKAKTYLSRAFSIFPNKSETFYLSRIQNFIKADMLAIRQKGVK